MGPTSWDVRVRPSRLSNLTFIYNRETEQPKEGNDQPRFPDSRQLSNSSGLGGGDGDHPPSRGRRLVPNITKAGKSGLERTGNVVGRDCRAACRVSDGETVSTELAGPRSDGVEGRMGVGRIWNWGPTGRRLRWGLGGGRGPARPAMPPSPASGRPPPGCPPHPVASPAPEGAGAKASASAPPARVVKERNKSV